MQAPTVMTIFSSYRIYRRVPESWLDYPPKLLHGFGDWDADQAQLPSSFELI